MKALLKNIKLILQKDEEISKLKKERFNIFNIIRKGDEEVALHSAFLAELLNCSGSHDFGNHFLKLFIKKFNIEEVINAEHPITIQLEKKLEDGRVDIFIEDGIKKTLVLIENKIYARDQNEQLKRYYKAIEKSEKGGQLFYLTLDGREASNESLGDRSLIDYRPISYQKDILEWLDDCFKDAVDHPSLRETIKQYINLIKRMTGQLTDKTMEYEIVNTIKANYSACKQIHISFRQAELYCVKMFIEELANKLKCYAEENNLTWEIKCDENFDDKWSGIYLSDTSWPSCLLVTFQGQPKIPWNDSSLGIFAHRDEIDRGKIKKLLENKLGTKYNQESLGYPFFHLNYNLSKIQEKIFDDEERPEIVDDVFKEMENIACELSKVKDELMQITK